MRPTFPLFSLLALLAFSSTAYANPSETDVDDTSAVMTERTDTLDPDVASDDGSTLIASDFGDVFVASFDAFDIACSRHALDLDLELYTSVVPTTGHVYEPDDTHGLALKPHEHTEDSSTLA